VVHAPLVPFQNRFHASVTNCGALWLSPHVTENKRKIEASHVHENDNYFYFLKEKMIACICTVSSLFSSFLLSNIISYWSSLLLAPSPLPLPLPLPEEGLIQFLVRSHVKKWACFPLLVENQYYDKYLVSSDWLIQCTTCRCVQNDTNTERCKTMLSNDSMKFILFDCPRQPNTFSQQNMPPPQKIVIHISSTLILLLINKMLQHCCPAIVEKYNMKCWMLIAVHSTCQTFKVFYNSLSEFSKAVVWVQLS